MLLTILTLPDELAVVWGFFSRTCQIVQKKLFFFYRHFLPVFVHVVLPLLLVEMARFNQIMAG